MAFEIKYNYPHTFFLSVSIVIMIFGFWPFYVNNFNWEYILKNMNFIKMLIHFGLILISIFCFFKGMKLWEQLEIDKEEIGKLRKEILKQTIESNKLEMDKIKINNEREQLIYKLSESKKNSDERTKIEVEIKSLDNDLIIKKQEIEKVTQELYRVKKEEISKTPNNLISGIAPVSSSYASISPIPNNTTFSGSYVAYSPAPAMPYFSNVFPVSTYCHKCKKIYTSPNKICLNCNL